MSLRAHRPPPRRFRGASSVRVSGAIVPVAGSRLGRLLGLALLDRRRAGAGLLIPSCCAVHTFGMRFPLDVVFLDSGMRAISRRTELRPRRFAFERGASAVLELPTAGATADAA